MRTAEEVATNDFVSISPSDPFSQLIGRDEEVLPADRNIQYVGLEELGIGSYQRRHLQRIVSHYAGDIAKRFKNRFQLTVHIKEYSRTGSRHKFSVHLRVTSPGATATHGHGWDVRSAVQGAFKRLESALSKKHKGKSRKSRF